ncbi:MAG: SOS response-associated peptidase [Candidatus Stahlbacteria bacterium]|nr:MAG: SOS response-associated peptidase [Candidatus Stahlbacteria bacterium]
MCGRFVFMSKTAMLIEEFGLDEIQWNFKPNYNIAPGQDVPGIVKNGKKFLEKFRWGFIPFWADDPSIGNRMINARAESVSEKRSFARAFRKRRCLVVADGFYEWRKEGNIKIPMYFHLRSGRPFGFAGLYETWKSKDGQELTTCAIITTEPNELIRPVHNRMPAIIEKDKRKLWLDNAIQNPEDLLPLLKPYNVAEMEGYEVSRKVNSFKINSPECIKPVDSISKSFFDRY